MTIPIPNDSVSRRWKVSTLSNVCRRFCAKSVTIRNCRNALLGHVSGVTGGIEAFVTKGTTIRAYWYYANNFGDWITPALLRFYGWIPIFTPYFKAPQFAGAGSVLQNFKDDYAGVILGTGFMYETMSARLPHANVLAVRGILTRQRIGKGEGVLLGDPGLLSSRLLPERILKEFRLGIVPHYRDRTDCRIQHWAERYGSDALTIDVRKKPHDVIKDIDRCECIVSSSLHGLIVADALGIPSLWMVISQLAGGRFKFDDYYTSLDINCEPLDVQGDEPLDALLSAATLKPQDRIEEIKESLDRLFSNLPALVTPKRSDNC